MHARSAKPSKTWHLHGKIDAEQTSCTAFGVKNVQTRRACSQFCTPFVSSVAQRGTSTRFHSLRFASTRTTPSATALPTASPPLQRSKNRVRRRRRRRFATSTAENRLSLSAVLRLTHFWKGVKLEEVCVAQASSFFTTAHHQPSTRGAGAARRPCITLPY